MPRIRTIKPEALQHRKVGKLSDRAFRLWVAMLTQSDDEGRLVCDADQLRLIALGYFPRQGRSKVEAAIQEVAASGLVQLYTVNGTRYANFPSWKDHQRIDRPSKSKLPPPPFDESSTNPQRVLDERSTGIGSERIKDQGSEGKGGERGGEPDGGLRSASPLEAASLRPPGNGDASATVPALCRTLTACPEPEPIDKTKTEAKKAEMLALIEANQRT